MVDYIKNEALGKHQVALVGMFLLCIILLGAIYIYFISSIVMATVARDHNIQNLQSVQREYQELEKQYLFLLSKFNLDYAYSLGFVNSGSALTFVSRQTAVAQNSAYDKTIR